MPLACSSLHRRSSPTPASRVAFGSSVSRACLLLACLASPVRAQPAASSDRGSADRSPEPRDRPTYPWIIPGGQEPLVARMLGGTSGLAGCSYTTAGIGADRVQVSFACEGSSAPVRVTLTHHDGGACPRTCTEVFVVDVGSGAPGAFTSALVRSIEEHESDFVWRRPEGPPRRTSVVELLRQRAAWFGFGALLLLVVGRRAYLHLRATRGARQAAPEPPPPSPEQPPA